MQDVKVKLLGSAEAGCAGPAQKCIKAGELRPARSQAVQLAQSLSLAKFSA